MENNKRNSAIEEADYLKVQLEQNPGDLDLWKQFKNWQERVSNSFDLWTEQTLDIDMFDTFIFEWQTFFIRLLKDVKIIGAELNYVIYKLLIFGHQFPPKILKKLETNDVIVGYITEDYEFDPKKGDQVALLKHYIRYVMYSKNTEKVQKEEIALVIYANHTYFSAKERLKLTKKIIFKEIPYEQEFLGPKWQNGWVLKLSIRHMVDEMFYK